MDGEYELEINSNEMCRNCLARSCQLNSLFRCDIIDGEVWSIPQVYLNVTDIKITERDNFPQNICTKCESSMIEAFTFKQKSKKSHDLLRSLLRLQVDGSVQPLSTERRSLHTQTPNTGIQESQSLSKVTKSIVQIECKNELACEIIEELEEEPEEAGEIEEDVQAWPVIYLENSENNALLNDSTELDNVEAQNDNLTDFSDMAACEYCCEQVDPSQLSVHSKQHNQLLPLLLSSIEYYRCSRCLSIFLCDDDLLVHMEADDLCDLSEELSKEDSCVDYQYLLCDSPIHLISCCKNIDSNTYSCRFCILDFVDFASFKAHFDEDHLIGSDANAEYMRSELIHSCGVCKISFKNLQDTLHHIYFHQVEYCCPYACEASSITFGSLYTHFIQTHSDSKVNCQYCSYETKDQDDLREHQRTLCAGRRFKCKLCEKSFFKKSTLAMHNRTHTDERRYQCTYCTKAFHQSNDLMNHLRTHTLERPYKCNQCDKTFKTIGHRNGHMSTHTTDYNFKCDICHKMFKSARILHGHKKVHDERQFHCEVCEKKFNRRYHLTLHMKRHEKRAKPTKTKKPV